MHVLIFYQYYHNPDCAASGRHYQFVKALSKHHRVSIITSDVWQHKRQSHKFEWAPPGVEIIHLPVPYDNAMGSGSRLKAYAGYAWQAIKAGMKTDRPDVILGSSTPLTAAWAAAKVAQMRRIPWVFEVRDLWPDFPVQMGAVNNKFLRKRLYNMEHRLYRQASHIIPLSPDMESHILKQGINADRVTTLLNGTDLEFAHQTTLESANMITASHGLSGKKIVLYAGTLGRANAIPQILETSRRMAHRQDIQFVFLGSGFFQPEIEIAAQSQPNLTLIESVPRHRIFGWFKAASLSLVSFIELPVLATNSPAKFFDSLAAGTPVIVTNAGWTKSFVEANACGWYASVKEPEALVRCIERVIDNPDVLRSAGCNGSKIAAQLFDRTKMAAQLDSILRQCAFPKGKTS